MTKRAPGSKSSSSDPSGKTVLAAYLATLLLYIIGAFLPGFRAWGINTWAYLPLYATALLVGVAAVGAFWAFRLTRAAVNDPAELKPINRDNRKYTFIALLIIVLWVLAFYLLKANTHFLGDGYALLGNLTKENPFAKPTEFGTALVIHWVKGLIGGGGDDAALMSYQLVSIGAGALFLAATALFAGMLMERLRDRVMLLLGLSSGGYMLLFFGYVENYALLCLSVAWFLMAGILILRGKANRYLIIVPLVLATFFHVVGLTLLPAALYVLLGKTSLGSRLTHISFGAKLVLATFSVVVAIVAFEYWSAINLYYRLAFVPIVQQQFTPAGYTLFSAAHIVDFLNLCIALCPGLLIVLVVAGSKSARPLFRTTDFRFLIIASLSTLGAVFMLDPKLGMARDWDLFSFSGLPLVMLGCLVPLFGHGKAMIRPVSLILVISLGLISLFSRAIIQHAPEMGTRLARDYMTMDLARNRWGFVLLQKYYQDAGDSANVLEIQRFRSTNYPETGAVVHAKTLVDQGRIAEAKQLLDLVLTRDPSFAEAWVGLGICYYNMRQYDSALFVARVADGLNPNNPGVLHNMGLAYRALNQVDAAELVWLRSVAIDSTFASLNLAHLYRDQGDLSKYLDFLIKAASRPIAGRDELKEAAQELIKKRQFSTASVFLNRLLAQGSDSSYVRELVDKYPELNLKR